MTSTPSQIILAKVLAAKKETAGSSTLIDKNDFWMLFRSYNPGFQITNENREIVFSIFRYFLQLPDFNEYGLIKNKAGLDKGLLVYGNYGVGKSTLFEAIHNIGKAIQKHTGSPQLWFPRISCICMLTKFYEAQKDPTSNFKMEYYCRGKLYLDDLGKEDKAYNREEIIGKLLFERHRKKLKTYVTTNDNPSAIAARYGNHIGDRLPEMFNIIKWEGKSWRE
jgi:hypothetical protein